MWDPLNIYEEIVGHNVPYLFVPCMERLAHMTQHEVSAGRWKPMSSLGVFLFFFFQMMPSFLLKRRLVRLGWLTMCLISFVVGRFVWGNSNSSGIPLVACLR